jgi:hypothetical protein
MMLTCLPDGEKYPRENSKHWIGRDAEDVPSGWMDDMVRRMLEQVNRQLIKLEDLKNDEREDNDPKTREQNARTLDRLERMLDRLIRLETMRSLLRSTKVAADNDETRATFMRRMDKLLTSSGAKRVPGEAGE